MKLEPFKKSKHLLKIYMHPIKTKSLVFIKLTLVILLY